MVGPSCLVGLSRDEEIVTADLDDGNRERIDHDQVCTPVGTCPECLIERIDGRVNIEALIEGNLGEDVIVGAVFRLPPERWNQRRRGRVGWLRSRSPKTCLLKDPTLPKSRFPLRRIRPARG